MRKTKKKKDKKRQRKSKKEKNRNLEYKKMSMRISEIAKETEERNNLIKQKLQINKKKGGEKIEKSN